MERCTYDVEYESEQKAEECGVKFSWEKTASHLVFIIKKVASVDVKMFYSVHCVVVGLLSSDQSA